MNQQPNKAEVAIGPPCDICGRIDCDINHSDEINEQYNLDLWEATEDYQ